MYSEKRRFGNIAEDIAANFLVASGYKIKERNFLRKVGEIDIVAEDKRGKLHFIEVKAARVDVPHETEDLEAAGIQVSLENDGDIFDRYLLEENVHSKKRIKFAKAISWYLKEKRLGINSTFSIDIFAVLVNIHTKEAWIRITENVSLLA